MRLAGVFTNEDKMKSQAMLRNFAICLTGLSLALSTPLSRAQTTCLP
jgi:hypothetical protein